MLELSYIAKPVSLREVAEACAYSGPTILSELGLESFLHVSLREALEGRKVKEKP